MTVLIAEISKYRLVPLPAYSDKTVSFVYLHGFWGKRTIVPYHTITHTYWQKWPFWAHLYSQLNTMHAYINVGWVEVIGISSPCEQKLVGLNLRGCNFFSFKSVIFFELFLYALLHFSVNHSLIFFFWYLHWRTAKGSKIPEDHGR